MISPENKLFEEIDKPNESRIISEDKIKGIVERQSTWIGQISGFKSFPSGTTKGQGNSKIFVNGISISNWNGTFTTEKGHEIYFIGKDVSKNGKFYVLRTFFTDVNELSWMNGLVCILEGNHDFKNNSFVCSGYKVM